MSEKKIVFVDMDGVLVDFGSGLAQVSPEVLSEYEDHEDDIPGVFSLMKPMEGAVDAFTKISENYDTYILSTAPWRNPTAWQDKIKWVHRHLGIDEGSPAYKRLILSHHKNLPHGDFLIDDRTAHGVPEFVGEHIHFGTDDFPDWDSVLVHLDLR